jgi:hypothetical protein
MHLISEYRVAIMRTLFSVLSKNEEMNFGTWSITDLKLVINLRYILIFLRLTLIGTGSNKIIYTKKIKFLKNHNYYWSIFRRLNYYGFCDTSYDLGVFFVARLSYKAETRQKIHRAEIWTLLGYLHCLTRFLINSEKIDRPESWTISCEQYNDRPVVRLSITRRRMLSTFFFFSLSIS